MVETALCCQDVLLSREFTAFSYASREGPGGFLGVESDLWGNKTLIENQPEGDERGPVKSPDTHQGTYLHSHTGRMQEWERSLETL